MRRRTANELASAAAAAMIVAARSVRGAITARIWKLWLEWNRRYQRDDGP